MLQRTPPSGFIHPCLPSTAERPPSGPDWVHEIKHDGYWMMARREVTGDRLLSATARIGPSVPRRRGSLLAGAPP